MSWRRGAGGFAVNHYSISHGLTALPYIVAGALIFFLAGDYVVLFISLCRLPHGGHLYVCVAFWPALILVAAWERKEGHCMRQHTGAPWLYREIANSAAHLLLGGVLNCIVHIL